MAAVKELTQTSFEQCLEEPGVMVVDFWARWCPPCRAMAPQFERAAALRSQYRFGKVDVDAEPGLAGTYGVRSIPTLLVLRDGEPVAQQAGVIGAQQLVQAVDRINDAPPVDASEEG